MLKNTMIQFWIIILVYHLNQFPPCFLSSFLQSRCYETQLGGSSSKECGICWLLIWRLENSSLQFCTWLTWVFWEMSFDLWVLEEKVYYGCCSKGRETILQKLLLIWTWEHLFLHVGVREVGTGQEGLCSRAFSILGICQWGPEAVLSFYIDFRILISCIIVTWMALSLSSSTGGRWRSRWSGEGLLEWWARVQDIDKPCSPEWLRY